MSESHRTRMIGDGNWQVLSLLRKEEGISKMYFGWRESADGYERRCRIMRRATVKGSAAAADRPIRLCAYIHISQRLSITKPLPRGGLVATKSIPYHLIVPVEVHHRISIRSYLYQFCKTNNFIMNLTKFD